MNEQSIAIVIQNKKDLINFQNDNIFLENPTIKADNFQIRRSQSANQIVVIIKIIKKKLNLNIWRDK